MNEVGKVDRTSPIATRKALFRSGFQVSDSAGEPAGVSLAEPLTSVGLLALQQVEDTQDQRNRRARASGQAALTALKELQAAFLAGQEDPGAQARLSTVLTATPAADPELAAIINDIQVRAAVELELRRQRQES
jgi:Class II flagellar assembly regulator